MINVKYKYKLQYNSLLGTIPDNDLFVKIKYRSNLSLWTETTYLYLLEDVQEGYLNGLQKKKTILEMMEVTNEATNL